MHSLRSGGFSYFSPQLQIFAWHDISAMFKRMSWWNDKMWFYESPRDRRQIHSKGKSIIALMTSVWRRTEKIAIQLPLAHNYVLKMGTASLLNTAAHSNAQENYELWHGAQLIMSRFALSLSDTFYCLRQSRIKFTGGQGCFTSRCTKLSTRPRKHAHWIVEWLDEEILNRSSRERRIATCTKDGNSL